MSTEGPTDQATEYISRWNAMKSERSMWDILWNDVALYIIPRKGNILTKNTPGQEQTLNIYDSTAAEALGIGAAGMVTNLCPAGEKWFRLAPKDEDAPESVKEWFDEASDTATDVIHNSNFQLSIHEDSIDALGFGSSLLLADEGRKKQSPVNFINIPVGTFAWEESAEGKVDVVGREWKWSARQAAQKWGKENLGRQQKEALNSAGGASNRKFTYIQFVEPREDVNYQGGPVAAKLRPIKCCYICIEDNQIIEEEGYYTMPFLGSRLLRSNNEIYGRGPGTEVMPEIKLVNAMERDILVSVEKMANPGWLVPDDAAYEIDNRPNGKNYWDTSDPRNKPEQIEYKNRVDMAEQKTEQKRQRIRRAFYNDLFQMLTNMDEQKREKTAYEVQQMVAEKLLLFSPLFARYAQEKLNPLLERVFDILLRRGIIKPPPPEAQGAQYEIVYTSKIALAIKAAENQAFATMMVLAQQAAALDPSVVNILNVRDGFRSIGRNVGIPAKLMRTDREVDQRTQAQMAAQQAQQQAETADVATRAVKNLGPEAQTTAARKIIATAGSPG